MCPHGGVVTHIPVTFTSYRIEGRPPMLLTDQYLVQGCPFHAGPMSPCARVTWVSGSPMLLVRGVPVLTQASIGLCQSHSGIPQGPAIVSSCQLMVPEPGEFTSINE